MSEEQQQPEHWLSTITYDLFIGFDTEVLSFGVRVDDKVKIIDPRGNTLGEFTSDMDGTYTRRGPLIPGPYHIVIERQDG